MTEYIFPINPTTVTTESGEIRFHLKEAEELELEGPVVPKVEGVPVELEYTDGNIMGSDLPNDANYGAQPQYNHLTSSVQVQIVEQPTPNKLRFR